MTRNNCLTPCSSSATIAPDGVFNHTCWRTQELEQEKKLRKCRSSATLLLDDVHFTLGLFLDKNDKNLNNNILCKKLIDNIDNIDNFPSGAESC